MNLELIWELGFINLLLESNFQDNWTIWPQVGYFLVTWINILIGTNISWQHSWNSKWTWYSCKLLFSTNTISASNPHSTPILSQLFTSIFYYLHNLLSFYYLDFILAFSRLLIIHGPNACFHIASDFLLAFILSFYWCLIFSSIVMIGFTLEAKIDKLNSSQ